MSSESIYYGPKVKDTKTFIQKAKWFYGKEGELFDYSNTVYTNSREKVKIECTIHGQFERAARDHLTGRGCPECTKNKTTLGAEEFINRSNTLHHGRYDYSLVHYKNIDTKVKIICPIHGEFEKSPAKHLRGQGCPLCSTEAYKRFRRSKEDFIKIANTIHGEGTYDYSDTEYDGAHGKLDIKCRTHGIFTQTANSHIMGVGCPKCSMGLLIEKIKTPWDILFQDFQKVHGDLYEYFPDTYTGKKKLMKIYCHNHGYFHMKPSIHLKGRKCPQCALSDRKKKFIEKAMEVHGSRFKYDMSDYKNNLSEITITCEFHGDFTQNCSKHIGGSGCPKCGIEGRKSPCTMSEEEMKETDAILYHIKIITEDGCEFEKIGITTRTIKERFAPLQKEGMKYNIIKQKHMSLKECYDEEQDLLEKYNEYRFKTKYLKETKIGGWTECFPTEIVLLS